MGLDEHNQTHTPNTLSKSSPIEEISIPLPATIKSSEPINNTNSEKTTPASKVKVHRCRQCSYVSSIKVRKMIFSIETKFLSIQ